MGRYAVAVTVNNRRGYVDELVAALLGNDLDGFDLVAAVEPNFHAFRPFPAWPGRSTVVRNAEQLGVKENPFRMLDRAFAEYDGVLYLEDDLLIAPDAVALARWYLRRPILGTVCLNLCNHNARSDARPDVVARSYYFEQPETPGFNPLGFAMTREQWPAVRTRWHASNDGWDLAVLRWMEAAEIPTFAPEFSRATHRAGALDGTHYRPDLHGRQFAGEVVYAGPPLEEFRLG